MSEKIFDDYDMEMSKWRGYVVRALEDSNAELKEIKEQIKNIEDKVDVIDKRLTDQNIKTGVIAGIVAFVAGSIISVVLKLLMGG